MIDRVTASISDAAFCQITLIHVESTYVASKRIIISWKPIRSTVCCYGVWVVLSRLCITHILFGRTDRRLCHN